MKIRLLTVGPIENPNLRAIGELYVQRIRHYLPIHLENIKQEKIKSLSPGEILGREATALRKKYQNGERRYILDASGTQYTSEKFAGLFQNLANQGMKQVTFVIGGPIGLADDIKKRDQRLSLGKMTLPHELAAVLLLEQIYRSQTIIRGEKYHK